MHRLKSREVEMKTTTLYGLLVGTILSLVCAAAPVAHQTDASLALGDAVGKWHSEERFEEEPRITVALRQKAGKLEGWVVMLGQTRKKDTRATLGLSFAAAEWDGRRFAFETILPDDEGTIGWELRVISATKAVLAGLTEDGKPLDAKLEWPMVR